MNIWIRKIWESLRANYWFVPSLMVLIAIVCALSLVAFDRSIVAGGDVDLPSWIYAGGAEGARNVLSAVAAAMMSVTSVVFSITIVALTLASGQFGPRLLRNFMTDRGSQITLGVFVATFVYALLILRTIRGGEEAFVPQVAATFALALAVLSTGVLIYFVHHIAEMIQADQIVSAVDAELRVTIDRLFPEELPEDGRQISDLPEDFDEKAEPVVVDHGDYIQGIDLGDITDLAAKHDIIVRFTHRPGNFVADGDRFALVYPKLDDAVRSRIRLLTIFGNSRTPTQDVEYGILQLVEVAVRSLSPGINDPFTAIACIDRLGSAIRRLSCRPEAPMQRHDDAGNLRVVLNGTTFDGHVNSAFNQIRQNARGSTAILIRLIQVLISIAEVADSPDRRDVIRRQSEMVAQTARRDILQTHDLADFEEYYARLLTTLDDAE
ncbi:MAG: DUF2254 domain-containing protein [Chthoniobacterales bacterium]